ncbi:hypothetical protein Hoch_0718 [Haliangium ochraceum DSM 14365]|uniref:Uncharacterized protein n=1 Tax=Haliangium ochraceum (strain DSM 14365 / JCM 11303 / SMP-2) TaxID=502025 RepID=D0LMX5_HALO1|nr:hypothetical protein Hoch_0718 [Haliangium ochraceum DSM 14365]
MSKSNSGRTGNPVGRPKKNSDRRVPYEEVDRLLVFGEVVACDDGKGVTTVYPSFREVARRYGVSHSVVTSYAQRHNCMRRREIAQARIEAKTDEKLTEMRANRFALTKDDELRIIDRYLSEFEEAVAAKRVPCDNPSDFNTMLRLKQFIQGGADSRQEVHAGFSLEALQARHRRMLRHLDEGDDAGRTSAADERDPETTPPALSSEPAPAELVAGRLDTFVSDRVSEARGNLRAFDEAARTIRTRPQETDQAPRAGHLDADAPGDFAVRGDFDAMGDFDVSGDFDASGGFDVSGDFDATDGFRTASDDDALGDDEEEGW